MAFMRTSNPALNKNSFNEDALSGERMTLSGTVNKTGILLICVTVTAIWSWTRFATSPEEALPLVALGAIGGFIVALITIFKKSWAPATAPIYALLEGLALGGISAVYEARFTGS